MVFVCPAKEETEKKTKILCKIKKLLKDIEDETSVPVNPVCVPCCVPVCSVPCPPQDKPTHGPQNLETPNIMVCYKIPKSKAKAGKTEKASSGGAEVARVKQSKSRELRASILYRGCNCEKHFGLQDDCPRTGCHGSPECLTKPPTCGPSEFCDGKHLGRKSLSASKKAGGSSEGDGVEHGAIEDVKYKCFPAVLKAPVCCAPC